MAHVCSVILVRRSFDIHHEQQKISLHNESILLLDKNLADDFAFCSLDTRRLDIEELTVCHYLQNIRQLPRNLGLHSKDRLLIASTGVFPSFCIISTANSTIRMAFLAESPMVVSKPTWK